jgi:tocopherol cyclase
MFYKQKHPEIFQGHMNNKNYFEGWYFKYVTPSKHMSLACIPGISLNSEDAHAFIQVFISYTEPTASLKTYYFRYPKESFTFDSKEMIVQVGQSVFKKNEIELLISDQDVFIQGHLKHKNMKPLPFNIMGPFAYMPLMETYHGIVSMSHDLEGSLMINQVATSFKSGKGYIEKDWGTSFPKAYTWIQSNHFKDEHTSIMASVAQIPFLGMHFKGMICTLLYKDTYHLFATYNFSKIKKLKHNSNTLTLHIKKGRYLLELEAQSEAFENLPSPRLGKMNESIKEGLSGTIHLKLYHKNKLIYEDTGVSSGIEIMLKDYAVTA